MISVINIFQPDLLMNLIENKCQFEQKFIFIYGNREAFLLINNQNYFNYEENLSNCWPSNVNELNFTISIDSFDDLKIFYIDSIIKNIFPKILFIHSQYSLKELEEKDNDNIFFNNHYSKEELSLFFEKVPYFGIHQKVSLIHLHKRNITEIDQKEVFVINFNNTDLKNHWDNYKNQNIFIIRLDDIQFYKLFTIDLIIRKIIPKEIISISKYSHEELFVNTIVF